MKKKEITVERITALVEEQIAGSDLFIGEVKVKPGNVIYVFLDGDSGVPISKCVEVSRHIEKNLDRDEADFELNVSSYGLGQPLKFLRQYKNAIGKQLTVTTIEGEKLTGILVQVNEQNITLQKKDNRKKETMEKTLQMQEVKVAKIDPIL